MPISPRWKPHNLHFHRTSARRCMRAIARLACRQPARRTHARPGRVVPGRRPALRRFQSRRTRRAWPRQGAAAVRVRRGGATDRMTQLAIYIPQVTVRVLKAQRTLAGDAVEADRIDGVASGDMPRRLVFWREEGEDVSGGSGPPAFAMELKTRGAGAGGAGGAGGCGARSRHHDPADAIGAARRSRVEPARRHRLDAGVARA